MMRLLSLLSLYTSLASAEPILKVLSDSAACPILQQSFSPAMLRKLATIQGPGFALRIVERPSNRFANQTDLVVLLGEEHVKTLATWEKGEQFVQGFQNFAVEGVGAEAGPRGSDVSSTLTRVTDDRKSTYAALIQKLGLRGSTIVAARNYVFEHKGKKLFYLDGEDPTKPLTLKQGVALALNYVWALPLVDFVLPQMMSKMDDPREIAEAKQAIVEGEANLPAGVSEVEKAQQEEIAREGGLHPKHIKDALVDVRNVDFARNIGLIFARSQKPAGVVLAIMGAAHVAGTKHQLMLYQGFSEITQASLAKCVAQ